MKFLIVACAMLAVACADISELGYNYQQPASAVPIQSFAPAPQKSYIPPAASALAPHAHYLAPVYQPAAATQLRYVPPAASAQTPIQRPASSFQPAPAYRPQPVYQPVPVYQPAPAYHQSASTASAQVEKGYLYNQPQDNQGYKYKTVRRFVYRHRV